MYGFCLPSVRLFTYYHSQLKTNYVLKEHTKLHLINLFYTVIQTVRSMYTHTHVSKYVRTQAHAHSPRPHHRYMQSHSGTRARTHTHIHTNIMIYLCTCAYYSRFLCERGDNQESSPWCISYSTC